MKESGGRNRMGADEVLGGGLLLERFAGNFGGTDRVRPRGAFQRMKSRHTSAFYGQWDSYANPNHRAKKPRMTFVL
jgi:hypothetical protein